VLQFAEWQKRENKFLVGFNSQTKNFTIENSEVRIYGQQTFIEDEISIVYNKINQIYYAQNYT